MLPYKLEVKHSTQEKECQYGFGTLLFPITFSNVFFSKRSNINLKLRVVDITVHLTPVSSNVEEVVRP